MRITMITPYYPIVDRPDLFFDTKAMHYFAKQWAKEGHEVTVIHMFLHTFSMVHFKKYKKHFGRRITDNVLDGVRILMMENRVLFRFKFIANLQLNVAAKRYNKFLRNMERPDVLLVHCPCRLSQFVKNLHMTCPHIGILHNSDIDALYKNENNIYEVTSNYNALGFRSLKIENEFKAMSSYDKPKFLVYSGAPLLTKNVEKKSFKAKEILQILYVGKLIKLKKIDIILKALKQTTFNYCFTIVGEGQELEYLKKLVKDVKLENKVIFSGAIGREQVIDKMNESDVFVMTSSPETFGLVYIEAMSQGCITIGSKGEGIDGIIYDGYNGFLVEPGNVTELRSCFEKIVGMSIAQLEVISENGIQTAQDMTEEKMAYKYLNYVKSVIGK